MLLALQGLLAGTPTGLGPPVDPNWLALAGPRKFTLTSPARALVTAALRRVYSTKAGTMPLVGDLSPFDPIEQVPMSIDFSAAIPTGDSAVTINAVSIAPYSGVDPNPAALLNGAAGRSGAVVTQMIGPGGVPGVTYRLTMTIATARGATISAYAHVFCSPVN